MVISDVFGYLPKTREASFLWQLQRAIPPPQPLLPHTLLCAAQPSTDAKSFLLLLQTTHTNITAQLHSLSAAARAGRLLDTQFIIVMTTYSVHAMLLLRLCYNDQHVYLNYKQAIIIIVCLKNQYFYCFLSLQATFSSHYTVTAYSLNRLSAVQFII